MRITRYRFLAELYPRLSMEAEVKDGPRTYYVNIDVNDRGEREELLDDGWESYNVPMDEADFNDGKNIVSDVDFSGILDQMISFWNAAPVFSPGAKWKGPWIDWPAREEEKNETNFGTLEELQKFAEMVNGIGYCEELHDLWEEAKEKGYIVIFGYSDDNMELRGAVDDEISCWDGGTFLFRKDENGRVWVSNTARSTYEKPEKDTVTAVWCGCVNGELFSRPSDYKTEDGVVIPWTYRTVIPHACFMMYEDEEPYCKGIVFSVEDLGKNI